MPGISEIGGFLGTAVNAVRDATSNTNNGRDWNYKDWRANVEDYYGNKGMSDYDKAFIYNSAIAAYQNDLALQNWNRENAYNTPEAQMQRYLAAGLNPNLVYGAGASSGNAGNIGTPTVGGQVSPTEIQDSRTRKAAQKMNAWQTAMSMLGSSLETFQKLMTIRGEIKATNAQNSANASQGLFNRDYWNSLGETGPYAKVNATLSDWLNTRTVNELSNRIGLYKMFNNGGLTDEEIANKPYFARLLDTQLENSQADLAYQNLMNNFKKLDWTLANDPDFGLKRFKQTEYDILKSRLKLQKADLKIKNRMYKWLPANNISHIISGLWPNISFGFNQKDITYHKNY